MGYPKKLFTSFLNFLIHIPFSNGYRMKKLAEDDEDSPIFIFCFDRQQEQRRVYKLILVWLIQVLAKSYLNMDN